MLMQAFSILPPKEQLVVALIQEGPPIPNLFSHISRFYLRSPIAGQMAAMYQGVYFHINSLHLHQVLDIHTLYTLKTCLVMASILTQNLSLWNIAYNMIRTL
jgi:hypothetical protein